MTERAVVTALYPNFIVPPEEDSKQSSGVGESVLWQHKSQMAGSLPTGMDILVSLFENNRELFDRCISLADIQFYEKYPELTPELWIGKRIFAWKSAAAAAYFPYPGVPYLDCTEEGSSFQVAWFFLGWEIGKSDVACLSCPVFPEALPPKRSAVGMVLRKMMTWLFR